MMPLDVGSSGDGTPPHIRSGCLRALAAKSTMRSPFLPDVPTTREAGYSSVQIENWVALVVPTGTPAATVRNISSTARATLPTAELQTKLNALGYSAFPMSEQALTVFPRKEATRWGQVVTEKNVRAE